VENIKRMIDCELRYDNDGINEITMRTDGKEITTKFLKKYGSWKKIYDEWWKKISSDGY
jgi:hypothetical protein